MKHCEYLLLGTFTLQSVCKQRFIVNTIKLFDLYFIFIYLLNFNHYKYLNAYLITLYSNYDFFTEE